MGRRKKCLQGSGGRIKGFKGSSWSNRHDLGHDWDSGYKTANFNPNS